MYISYMSDLNHEYPPYTPFEHEGQEVYILRVLNPFKVQICDIKGNNVQVVQLKQIKRKRQVA